MNAHWISLITQYRDHFLCSYTVGQDGESDEHCN